MVAPSRTATLPPRNWQIPVAVGKARRAPPADVLLLQGSTDIAAGSCGEAIKVNLGDIGYYRVAVRPGERGRAGQGDAADVADRPRQFPRR